MSAISQVSISRPVLAGVMSVLLILFGIVGYNFLGTREYPVTDSPIVMVTTVYPGASADIIASQVTKPLEEAIAEANGIRSVSSTSREQVSIITVEFELNVDLGSGCQRCSGQSFQVPPAATDGHRADDR